jgi:hypothetical protein
MGTSSVMNAVRQPTEKRVNADDANYARITSRSLLFFIKEFVVVFIRVHSRNPRSLVVPALDVPVSICSSAIIRAIRGHS